MPIAALVIEGLTAITTSLIGGKVQSDIIKEGEKESRSQYLSELAERRKERAEQIRLTKAQMAENKREFNVSTALKQKELDITQGEIARKTFREQVQNLTGILDKNESLKNLYINRLASLRS